MQDRPAPSSDRHDDRGPDRVDPSRSSAADRRRLSGPGLRTFLAIADLWGLSEAQRLLVLGMPPRSTYYHWVQAAQRHGDITLSLDTLLRISAVLGIYKGLRILFATERDGIEWLRAPHTAPTFGGQSPLSLVTNGTQDGLLLVRRFIDAARGGLYMAPNELDKDFVSYTDGDIVFA